jgi:FkbM family methyltransferase
MSVFLQRIVGPTIWKFTSWYRDQFGIFPAMVAFFRSLLSPTLVAVPNPLNGEKIFLRPGTADQSVYADIFGAGEYDINFNHPKVIVDAGAHIGIASVVFASRYPEAKIYALEPEPSNFEVLRENTRAYNNIHPLRAGLWDKRTNLSIQNTGAETWSFRVMETASDDGIPAIDVLSLMRDFQLERIDVLKIDIEGSEIEVFQGSAPWMHFVDTLVVELHDRFRPGCTKALEAALAGFDYHRAESGENIIFFELKKRGTPDRQDSLTASSDSHRRDADNADVKLMQRDLDA